MSCCGSSKFNKYIWLLIGLIILAAVIFSLASCSKKEPAGLSQVSKVSTEKKILYYTCGMHPQVKVSIKEYNKGKTKDPICGMDLVPVYKEKPVKKSAGEHKIIYYRNPMNPAITSPVPTKDPMGMDYIPVYKDEISGHKEKGAVARVRIEKEQLIRADIATVPVRMLRLFKKIRTVGKIAYDPQLAIAQDEFIASLRAQDKIKMSDISDRKSVV